MIWKLDLITDQRLNMHIASRLDWDPFGCFWPHDIQIQNINFRLATANQGLALRKQQKIERMSLLLLRTNQRDVRRPQAQVFIKTFH